VLALGLGVPVVGTAVDGLARTMGEGRGVLVPAEAPRALAGALSRVLASERPDPALGRACAGSSPPAQRPRYRPAPTASCSPAAPDPGSRAGRGLDTSAARPLRCRAAAVPASCPRLQAASSQRCHMRSEKAAGPDTETSAASRDDGRPAPIATVTARDGGSVREGAPIR
jgi:hypothetical protein